MNRGALERNAGLGFAIVAFVLLGTALFSALLHTEGSSKMGIIGMSILFAGGYFAYGAKGVSFRGCGLLPDRGSPLRPEDQWHPPAHFSAKIAPNLSPMTSKAPVRKVKSLQKILVFL